MSFIWHLHVAYTSFTCHLQNFYDQKYEWNVQKSFEIYDRLWNQSTNVIIKKVQPFELSETFAMFK